MPISFYRKLKTLHAENIYLKILKIFEIGLLRKKYIKEKLLTFIKNRLERDTDLTSSKSTNNKVKK